MEVSSSKHTLNTVHAYTTAHSHQTWMLEQFNLCTEAAEMIDGYANRNDRRDMLIRVVAGNCLAIPYLVVQFDCERIEEILRATRIQTSNWICARVIGVSH
jgi:hypothetical protein